MIYVAVLGYGTVGSGVVEVIERNRDSINKRVGDEVEVRYVLDLREFPGNPIQDVLVHDFDIIVNDPEVSVVVETMGGLKPAFDFTKRALEAGKSVCTSNKELVAEHGLELMHVAEMHNANYLFEASCGGGIPIIRALNSSLTADEIDEVSGILNGTTNYILTKMARDGSDFDTALKEAQQNGYAERNPEADIEGRDACRKIAILSSIAYGRDVRYQKVYTEGISKITAEDMKYANAMGCSIKLLGQSRIVNGGIYAMVCPTLINVDNPLYSVQGVFNAIFVHGNVLGDAMFYGSGAGSLPTASAVVADVVDCAKHRGDNVMNQWSDEEINLIDIDEVRGRFFVRVAGSLAGELNNVKEVFGDVEPVSIPGTAGEFGFITKEMSEREYKEKAAKLPDIITMIRARV